MSDPTATRRADWQRSRERLLAAASDVVRRDGARASLEEIARQAGVGSATLHRHFASREMLLSEVFEQEVLRLADRGRELADAAASDGLSVWLDELVRYTAATRGLAVTLRLGGRDGACYRAVAEVAERLAANAAAEGRLRTDVTAEDLLAIANGVAIQAEERPDFAARLLHIALDGAVPTEQSAADGPVLSRR